MMMIEQLWQIKWTNNNGKELSLTHLKLDEVNKFHKGFISEGKDSIVSEYVERPI